MVLKSSVLSCLSPGTKPAALLCFGLEAFGFTYSTCSLLAQEICQFRIEKVVVAPYFG
jgi:hypothetical protein